MAKFIKTVFNITHTNFEYKNQFNKLLIKYYKTSTNCFNCIENDVNDRIELDKDSEYEFLASKAMNIKRNYESFENVFVVIPYIKWGPKVNSANPDLQLDEAVSLVTSLPKWDVVQNIKVPLQNFAKPTFFGKGKLAEIEHIIKSSRNERKISSLFINKNMLSGPQKLFLEKLFNVPVYDRYSIVIQILRQRSTSTEAKLQVAMAEIPYIKSYFRELEHTKYRIYLEESQRHALQARETKLKARLSEVRAHRELLRSKRKTSDFPIVAVVGYTNAGKTNLIKTLTGLNSLQPRDQLFATLDVTAHAGLLPCHLKVIYLDTVGFITDIPTTLLECFVATLEDVIFADLIIHVHDVAHPNYLEQKRHVEQTLQNFLHKFKRDDSFFENNVINVGNKWDLVNETDFKKSDGLIYISATKLMGINQLLESIEEKLLLTTGRVKMTFKVPMGGEEAQWLYKNSTVTNSVAYEKNEQFLLLSVVISQPRFKQFQKKYIHK